MLNREFRLDIVKKPKNGTEAVADPESTFEARAMFVSKLVEENVQKIMGGIFAYVLLDTFRKVVVGMATKSSQK